MSRGGHNRSGRRPDETSGRSERSGFKLTALPAEGYSGPVPPFPLPSPSSRELEVWEQAWRTPQACAWSLPSESWRLLTIGLWVRTFVRCEDPESGASLSAQLHRFADQIGMTTAGLAEMGWKVASDELSGKRQDPPARQPSARDRMRVVEPAEEKRPARRLRDG